MIRMMSMLALLLAVAPALAQEPAKVQSVQVTPGMWKKGEDGQPIACTRFLPPKKTIWGPKLECDNAWVTPQAFLDNWFKGRARLVDAKPTGGSLIISFTLAPGQAEAVMPPAVPPPTGEAPPSGG